jgi:ABC-type dipeptide/oligopeptide/nickel transport system permease subunit
MKKEETVQGTRVALVLGILAIALAMTLALVACVAASPT